MCYIGVFKRLAPFLLTLIAGIFIASIFVDISPFAFRPLRINRTREMQQLRMDNDRLRQENEILRRQVGVQRLGSIDRDDFNIPPVPAPNMDAPPPLPRRGLR
jgi:hypothetical protein